MTPNPAMEHALHLVPVHWHPAFVRFMDTGEAPQAFFEYLEADADCRQACEIVLRGDTELEFAVRLSQDRPGREERTAQK
jgi:hypothetical protein